MVCNLSTHLLENLREGFVQTIPAEEEKVVVEELKRRTINDVTPKMLQDVSLFHRFAKARDFNLIEAEAMLRKHIAWRKEMQIDTILTDYEPPEVLLKYVPSSHVCLDKEGCAVRILDAGRTDAKGLWNASKKMDFAKFCAFLMEQDKEMVFKNGGNKLGKRIFYPIYDIEGLTYANAVHMKTLQNAIYILKMLIDNYPESISVLTVINAPVYFKWVYAAMKPILPPAVIQKVRVFGTDGWKEVLLQDIDADNLPVYLGGNRTDPDGNPFCETFIVRGKPVPKSYYMQNRIKELSLDPYAKKLTVMPFSKEEISVEVKEENSYLEWEFETKNRDISFLLHFRPLGDFKPIELIPKQRIDTSYELEKGCLSCEKLGIYTIVFDNSYSWIHSKEVYCRIAVKDRKENELYKLP